MANIILTGASGIGKTTLLHEIFGLDRLVTPKTCIKKGLHPTIGQWSYFGYIRLDRCIPENRILFPQANRIIADTSHAVPKTISTFNEYEWIVMVLDIKEEEHRRRFFNRRSSRSGLDKEKSFQTALKEQQAYLKKYKPITEEELKNILKSNET